MAVDLGTYLARVLPHLRAEPHPDFELPCQIWQGARRGHDQAYGAIWYQGKSRRVHRVVWKLLTGAWPRMKLLHGCDRTLCAEVTHLREGTHAENMADRDEPRDELADLEELIAIGNGETPF